VGPRRQTVRERAERAVSARRAPDRASIDELLTDCVAEVLVLRAEIRRLESAREELIAVVARLRWRREQTSADSGQ
jgi:hypothetical protein